MSRLCVILLLTILISACGKTPAPSPVELQDFEFDITNYPIQNACPAVSRTCKVGVGPVYTINKSQGCGVYVAQNTCTSAKIGFVSYSYTCQGGCAVKGDASKSCRTKSFVGSVFISKLCTYNRFATPACQANVSNSDFPMQCSVNAGP